MSEEDRRRVEAEEEQKRQKTNMDFHKTQGEILKAREGNSDPLYQTNYAKRDERLFSKASNLPAAIAKTSDDFSRAGSQRSVAQQSRAQTYSSQQRPPLLQEQMKPLSSQQSASIRSQIAKPQPQTTKNDCSKPMSSQSAAAPSSQAGESRRQIRTGGFQRLGESIAIK